MTQTIDISRFSPVQSQAQEQHRTAVDLLQEMRDLPVETQADIEFASESLAEIKGDRERLKAVLDSVVDPIQTSVNILKSWFKPGLDTFDQCEKVLKEKIKIAYDTSFQKQHAALKEAAEASIAGDEDAADEAMDRANEFELQPVKGLQLRNTWDFEIEDWNAVPDEYKVIDEKKVMAVIRAHKGKVNIPGIKPIRKTGVASGKR
jgi:hypothetical protein